MFLDKIGINTHIIFYISVTDIVSFRMIPNDIITYRILAFFEKFVEEIILCMFDYANQPNKNFLAYFADIQ